MVADKSSLTGALPVGGVPADQPGMVVWFTGLSGAGKTTLATAVSRTLRERGYRAPVLDGDVLRVGLCSDLGFSIKDRHENVRRAGAVAGLMAEAGVVCVVALISPFRSDRATARALVQPGRFVEVFVDAPLAVCEQRDVKGLYRRARANEIPEFTGISSPYEPPESPEVTVRSDLLSIEASVALVLKAVEERQSRGGEGNSR
jgi:adenylylsulfate kinase